MRHRERHGAQASAKSDSFQLHKYLRFLLFNVFPLLLLLGKAAAEEIYDLDIVSTEATVAIKALSRQTGHAVIFQSAEVKAVKTNPLSGRYSLPRALKLLLDGTVLSGDLTKSGVITISSLMNNQESENRMNMMKSKKGLLAALVGFFSAAGVGTTVAQEVGKENIEFAIEEIIITAQKREQNLMDVGISVSVVDEQAIRDQRIEQVTDIVLFTANTSAKETIPGLMPVIAIRGVGLNDFSSANNPSVGVYVDDVALSSLALMSSDFIDLASVEVLKGPQGTLYGRNSTAGALSFHAAKPALEAFEARVSAGVGNYGVRELDTMVNAPLSSDFGLRLAAKQTLQNEGYWFNRMTGTDMGERDELTVRVQALWEPADGDSSVLLKLEQNRGRSELGAGEFFGLLPTASFSDCPGSPQCADFFGYTDTDGDPYKGDWSVDPDYNKDQFSATLRVDWDLGFAEFTSVTGYIDFDREYTNDTDAAPSLKDFYDSDSVQQFSEELRLTGSTDRADWQLGLIYAVDKVDSDYFMLSDLFNTSFLLEFEHQTTSQAVFANADWVLNDELTLVTGLRFSHEEKDNMGFAEDLVSRAPGSFLTSATFGSPPITIASIDDTISDKSVEWKLGINWKPNDATLVYASAAQGTKSGGFFTGPVVSSAQLQPYDKETLLAYEVGIRSQLPGFGISYELNAFYYDYQDVQTFIRDTSGALSVQRLDNVDEADIYGLDATLQFRPTSVDGLTLAANLGFLKTELSSFVASEGVVPAGNEQPDSPDLSLHLSASYNARLSENIDATFAVAGRYQSEVYRDALNDPFLKSDSYWVTNARMSLYFGDDLELTAWGKNLEDKRYVTMGLNGLVLGGGFRIY